MFESVPGPGGGIPQQLVLLAALSNRPAAAAGHGYLSGNSGGDSHLYRILPFLRQPVQRIKEAWPRRGA